MKSTNVRIFGVVLDAGAAMVAEMQDVCPAFADITIEWALGGIMARPGLDLITRELILVASCVTMRHAMPLQLTFHAGGPAVRNSLVVVQEVFGRQDGP